MNLQKHLVLALISAFVFATLPTGAAAQTSHIRGEVKDETGAGIKGAIVYAETVGSAATHFTTATDERGRFIIIVNRSGQWNFNIEAPGFAPARLTVPMRLGASPPSLEIKLDRQEAPEAVGALAGVNGKALTQQLESAAALIEAGQYDQAIAAYRDIRTRTPALTSVSLQLGQAYLLKKSYAEAETAFQELLKANSRTPTAAMRWAR